MNELFTISNFANTEPSLVVGWLYEAFMSGLWCPILAFLAFVFWRLAEQHNNNN